MTAPESLRVLTFNTAGLPFVHAGLARRLAASGRALAEGGYDIVGLQELWRDGDSARLARASGLRHSARRATGLLTYGSGLTILSRWPIAHVEERPFSILRPSLRNLAQGEPLVEKGLLLARVATPWGELDVYNAHTLSDYPEISYQPLRLTELFDLAEAVWELSARRPFLVLGDLNAALGDLDYETFKSLLGVRDLGEDNGQELCPDPTRPQRVDHVLAPEGGRLVAPLRLALEGPIPGPGRAPLAYSDHVGFRADLPVEALLPLRAKPSRARRDAALREVEASATRTIDDLETRKRIPTRIPFYAALRAWRYDRQAAKLAAVRARAAAARERG